jgi:hypothetical protein
LKYDTDYFSFRDRDTSKEISPKRFRISTYLSKTETIEKALKEAERFE